MLSYYDDYLTEDEDDDENENYDKLKNFSTFIKTQLKRNTGLRDYLNMLGWDDAKDTQYFDGAHLIDIYILLTPKAKNTMKNNYMPALKHISGNDFELAEERRGGRKRKSRKSKKTRKMRKSRKTK